MDPNTPPLDDTWLMLLLAGSLFSLITLVGLYLYAGTLIPLTEHETFAGAVVIWTIWGALVAMPVITAARLIWRHRRRGR